MQTRPKGSMPTTILFCILLVLFCLAPPAGADTVVNGGTISVDTVWDAAGSPYIVNGTITIMGTDGDDQVTTLTIEPGVEVRMGTNLLIQVGGYNSSDPPGALNAVGTAAAPIRFTSNSQTPAPGNWGNILIYNMADDDRTRLSHCIIEYAGYSNRNALSVHDARPVISSCVFLNNAYYDFYCSGTVGGSVTGCEFNHGINFAGTGRVTFEGNKINWNNDFPVRAPADNVHDIVADTAFSNLDDNSALFVSTNNLTLDGTWRAAIPYVVSNNGDFRIQGTDGDDKVTTLTLEPGVQVRVQPYRSIQVGGYYASDPPGALNAVGTAGAPIRFTSNSQTPAPGNWGDIHIYNSADDDRTRLSHCIIEYAGNSNRTALSVYDAGPVISSCAFVNNAFYDLFYSGTVGGSVTGCTFNHGINFTGTGRVPFEGNTINWSNDFPVKAPADNVADLVADTTFTGLDADSALFVSTNFLTLDSTWRAVVPYVVANNGDFRIQGDGRHRWRHHPDPGTGRASARKPLSFNPGRRLLCQRSSWGAERRGHGGCSDPFHLEQPDPCARKLGQHSYLQHGR